MNTGVHVSFSVMVFLGYVPSNGLVGSDGSFIPSFLRNLHTVLHSGYISLHTYQQCKRAPFSSHPLQHLLFVDFFSLSFFFFFEVAQSCPTLCDPMGYSLPRSSLHGILQGRVLEWVAISFSRGSSHLRDWTRVSHIPGRSFNLWATREVPCKFLDDGHSEWYEMMPHCSFYLHFSNN